MDEEIRKKIEAILFSIGRKASTDELSKMTKIKDKGKLVAALLELKKKYNNDDNNSLMILQDGDNWKLTIKDQYIDVAKEIGIETELTKSVMETLAVIAYKNPIIQSDVIKARTNKAYDHLRELEEMGYITREVWGRSKKIKLTQKFFDYFDLPPNALKETFGSVEELEKKVEEKEKELHQKKIEQGRLQEEQKIKDSELANKNIYMEIKVPENYKEEKDDDELSEKVTLNEETIHDSHGIDVITKQKLGNLEIVDEDTDNEEKSDSNDDECDEEKEKKDNNTPKMLGNMEVYEEPGNYISPSLEDESDEEKEEETEYEESIMEEENLEFDKKNEANNENENNNQENLENIQEEKDNLNFNDEKDKSDEENKNQDLNIENSDDNKPQNPKNTDFDNNKNTSVSAEQLAQAVEDALKKQQNNSNNDNIDSKDDNIEDDADDQYDEIMDDDMDIEGLEDNSRNEAKESISLKEDEIFEMDGIPSKIMEKIEEKSEEILGEKHKTKKKDDFIDL